MREEKTKEYMDDLKNRDYDDWFPFECIERRISLLRQFTKIIDAHPDELLPSYQSVIKKRGLNPSEPLIDFILLDIRNFYGVAYKKYGNDIDYPDSFDYVRALRDTVLAHFSKDSPMEVVRAYEEIQKIGFDKIWEEFTLFKEFIKTKVIDQKS